ncbi:MAG: hypothetical protein ACKOPM_16315 [Novosphingobium sp.]
MIKPTILAFAGAALVLSPSVMAKPALFDSGTPIAFTCTLSGGEKLRPALDPAAVCAQFKRRIEAEIARQTRAVPAFPARGQAIAVAVKIIGPREASATMKLRARGRSAIRPEITLDVMDKSIGMRDLESLATQVARSIAQP